MPRPKKTDRPKRLEIHLPTSVHEKVMEELFSDVEQRVPFGALSQLAEVLFTNWLESRGVKL